MATNMIGTRLKTLRDRRGWTQERLSDVARISTRTVQRIERGSHRPSQETLRALAKAFDVDVSSIRHGFTADDLSDFEDAYLCPTCGARLEERTFVDHEYGDAELEVFACGYTRGWQQRPCTKDPRFPKFDDYELHFSQESDGSWWCYAIGKTEAASQVHLQNGMGSTREEAKKWVERSFIQGRDGYDAANRFLPF